MAWCISFSAHAQTPRIDELKEQITANPDSFELGAWQIELAEHVLTTLNADGADTSALFGMLTVEQEDRVRRVASESLELARQSAANLMSGAAALAAHPEFADRRDLQDRRSELAVEYALIRRPLAHARAAALLASVGFDSASMRTTAINQLSEFDRMTPVIDARRIAILGAFAVNAAMRDTIQAIATDDVVRRVEDTSHHTARELILIASRAIDSAAIRREYLHAQLIRHESQRPLDGLLAREFLLRLQLDQSPTKVGSMTDALVVDSAKTDASLASLILAKSARLLARPVAPDTLSPLDRVAIGRLELDRGSIDDAAAHLKAGWSALTEADGAFKRLCGWDLARALRERGTPQDIADAGAVLLELAQFADEPNAEQALASSIELLQWSDRALARTGADRTNVGAALRRALRLGLQRWPSAPGADEWRLALANVVGGAERRDLLESITARSSAAYPRARMALAWITYADLTDAPSGAQREALAFTMLEFADQARSAAEQSADAASDSLEASIQQARAVALAELRRFDAAAEAAMIWNSLDGRNEPDTINVVRRSVGEALRESLLIRDSDRAAALGSTLDALCAAAFQRILANVAARNTVDSIAIDLTDALRAQNLESELFSRMRPISERIGVTRGVGIALGAGQRATGDDATAFQTLRNVVDASRALDVTDDFYWRAWAGMLEILSDQNDRGARSESILRQIARLKAEDNALGGELTKRRIEAVERRARLAPPSP